MGLVKMTARVAVTGGFPGTGGSDFMVGKVVLAVGRRSPLPHGPLQRTACVLTAWQLVSPDSTVRERTRWKSQRLILT